MYRAVSHPRAVNRERLRRVADILCRRAGEFGLRGFRVGLAAEARLELAAESEQALDRSAASLTQRGEIAVLDWEANVLGEPDSAAPSLLAAARVAAGWRAGAAHTFYRFGRDRRAGGGPTLECGELFDRRRSEPCARMSRSGVMRLADGGFLVALPRGVTVLRAEPWPSARARYFAVRTRRALSHRDMHGFAANADPVTGEPTVTLEFNRAGRARFKRLTRRLAQRGRRLADREGGDPHNQAQRFAFVLDERVLVLGAVNFRTDPRGVDARLGAQIPAGRSTDSATRLAAILESGPLLVTLDPETPSRAWGQRR